MFVNAVSVGAQLFKRMGLKCFELSLNHKPLEPLLATVLNFAAKTEENSAQPLPGDAAPTRFRWKTCRSSI